MRAPTLRRWLAFASLAAAVATAIWWMIPPPREVEAPFSTQPVSAEEPTPANIAVVEPTDDGSASRRYLRSYRVAEKLLGRLRTALSDGKTRPNEAVLTFKDQESYERFLARCGAAGLRILGKLDRMRTVRVGYDSIGALAADIAANADDYADVDGNYMVYPPDVPEIEPRFAGKLVPIGNNLLEFLGATGDTSRWGAGVTVAVLDSGVLADATFGNGRLRFLDVGFGIAPAADNGHGTAVASLVAGMNPDAIGIAPAANLLSIRVTGADGLSDSFTLAQAVMAAVDAGVQIINVSMGSYSNSYVMTNAVDYATLRGVLIVASGGNDQASMLTWPAADPRVISVGAVDAAEQQVVFSNAGEQLKLTAPGYGLQTAWTNGDRIFMDGTSASAPVVTGGVAAMMSQNPGLTATQAAELLQRYASDGGPVGPDRNFGNGILNMGWAMNRSNFNRIDTAVSSQYLDVNNFQMQFVVQNRSAQSVANMELKVTAGFNDYSFKIPALGPGGTYPVRIPVDYMMLQSYGRIDYRTRLINPSGVMDVLPANNERANSVSMVQPR